MKRGFRIKKGQEICKLSLATELIKGIDGLLEKTAVDDDWDKMLGKAKTVSKKDFVVKLIIEVE